MDIPKLGRQIGTETGRDIGLRKLVTAVIRHCPKSREQIAEEMSVHAGQRISKRMLDDWTAESKKPARFPAFLIQSFCEVTGDDQLQRWMMGPRLRKLLEFGESAANIFETAGGLRSREKAKRLRRGRAQ